MLGCSASALGEHDHGQRLAAAGGVPNDAAGARALMVEMGHPLDGGLHTKVLLVTGDHLADGAVIDDIAIDQLEQALWLQQAVEGAVLDGGQAVAGSGQGLKVGAHAIGALAPVIEMQGRLGRERPVDQGMHLIAVVDDAAVVGLLAPEVPPSLGRGGGGIEGVVDADREQ